MIHTFFPVRAGATASALVTLACLPCPPAVADEQDSINVTLSESLVHDQNLFRLPDGVSPQQLGLSSASRGDTVRSDQVALSFDKGYGLQRLAASVSLVNQQYSRHGFLDHQTKSADGRWQWALTPTLGGTVAASRSQALQNFADYQTYARNLRTTDQYRASAEYGLRGPWRLTAAVRQTEVTDSVPQAQTWDTRTQAAEAGVRYVTAGGNAIGYVLRGNRVTWLDRPLDPVRQYDSEARQTDHEVSAEILAWPKTQARGSITRVDRRHDHMPSRDYQGTGGRLDFTWAPAAALKIEMQWRRELTSWWDAAASYAVTDTLALAPSWTISPKLSLRGRIEESNRDFRGPVLPFSGPAREDTTRSGQVALEWLPARMAALSAYWRTDRRHSSHPGLDFDAETVGLSAQLRF